MNSTSSQHLTPRLSLQFNGQPDQVSRIIGTDSRHVLYFCEVSHSIVVDVAQCFGQ